MPHDWDDWTYIMERVAEGRHPPNEYLRRVIAKLGIPQDARVQAYVASRIGTGPGKKPCRELDDPELFGEFSAQQACALMDLYWLHGELATYETTEDGPARRTLRSRSLLDEHLEYVTYEVELRKIKSLGVWVVKEPKPQARKIIADRYCVSPHTVEDWERMFNSGKYRLGQIF